MATVILIGRILFALALFVLGYDNVTEARQKAEYASQKGLVGAGFLVPVAGILLIVGCVSIALGFYAEIGAILVLAFLVPVTVVMHDFWKIGEPQARQGQRIHFFKNIALIGGALLIAAYGAGPLSITQPIWTL